MDDDAGEEGNGYDLGSAACESSLKPASNGGGAGVAVEADIGEVGGKGGVVGEDQVAGVRVSAVVCSVLGLSAPVPDGQVGSCYPRSDTAEAEGADEAGEVEGRVGAESERAYGFVEVSAQGHATAIEIDGCVVVDGVLCCDQEGTAVVQDNLGGVGECVACGGLQCAAVNSGGSRVSVVSSAALPVVMPEMRFSDHLCYWDEGFPAFMLTDTALFRNPNYHKHTDTVDTLDFKAMASITENLVSALARLVGISPSS